MEAAGAANQATATGGGRTGAAAETGACAAAAQNSHVMGALPGACSERAAGAPATHIGMAPCASPACMTVERTLASVSKATASSAAIWASGGVPNDDLAERPLTPPP